MKFSAIAAVLASASAAHAHSIVRAVFINGVDQGLGLGTYIRNVPNNSPVKDLTSKDMICNVGNAAAPKTLEVSSGDVITFEWSHDNRNDDIIDPSHKGPVQVYVAPTASNGDGAVWAKIFSQGFTDDWATNKLIAAKGHVSVTVPDLAAGEYLFRPEIIALHEGDTAFTANSARGAQFYMECVQFKVVSSGSLSITDGINFLTDYTYSDKGIVFNVYGESGSSYVAPGGALSSIAVTSQAGIGAVPAAGSKPTTAAASSSAAATTAVASTSAAATTSAVASTTAVASTSAAAPTTTAAAPATTEAAATSAAPVETTPAAQATTTSRAALPTTKMVTSTIKASAAAASATSCSTTGSSGAAVAKYYQCGGINYTGSTTCAEGSTCTVQNPYYSQCL